LEPPVWCAWARQERKLAILLYGFPPGVGATGTAALLNVPKSLEALLATLRREGYNLGEMADDIDGEALVSALKLQEDQRAIIGGAKAMLERRVGTAGR
jgi:magnesium chelatase subunit H